MIEPDTRPITIDTDPVRRFHERYGVEPTIGNMRVAVRKLFDAMDLSVGVVRHIDALNRAHQHRNDGIEQPRFGGDVSNVEEGLGGAAHSIAELLKLRMDPGSRVTVAQRLVQESIEGLSAEPFEKIYKDSVDTISGVLPLDISQLRNWFGISIREITNTSLRIKNPRLPNKLSENLEFLLATRGGFLFDERELIDLLKQYQKDGEERFHISNKADAHIANAARRTATLPDGKYYPEMVEVIEQGSTVYIGKFVNNLQQPFWSAVALILHSHKLTENWSVGQKMFCIEMAIAKELSVARLAVQEVIEGDEGEQLAKRYAIGEAERNQAKKKTFLPIETWENWIALLQKVRVQLITLIPDADEGEDR